MLAKVSKWGNSRAIRIPKALALELGLEPGAEVTMTSAEGELRIRPRRRKKHDLDKLLASVPDDFDEGEWDIGPPVGNEIW